MQRVDGSRPVPPASVLCVAADKPVLFQRLQVIGKGADGNATLPAQKLLRGPAAAFLVRAIGKGHEDQLPAPCEARIAAIEHSGNMLNAHPIGLPKR